MVDGEGNAPGTTPAPGAAPASPPDPGQGSSPGPPSAPAAPAERGTGDEDDEVRDAAALLRNHRAVLEQRKKDQAELTQLRAKVKQADDAQLSEQERLTKRVKELEGRESTLQQQVRAASTRYEIALASQKLGIVDADAAYRLLDPDALEFDEAGVPTNTEKALAALVKARPYLQQTPSGPPAVPGTTNGASRARSPEGARIYRASELNDTAFFRANEADIRRAMNEGRVLADQ